MLRGVNYDVCGWCRVSISSLKLSEEISGDENRKLLTLKRISGKVRSHIKRGNCHLLTISGNGFSSFWNTISHTQQTQFESQNINAKLGFERFDKPVVLVVPLERNCWASWWPTRSNTFEGVGEDRLWHVGFFCGVIVSWWLVGMPMGGAMVGYGVFGAPIGGRGDCVHSSGPPLVTDSLG